VQRSKPPVTRAADAPGARALAQLVACLDVEGQALARGDVDALALAVQDKEQAVRRLATELASADGGVLREAIRRARDLNERNARLLVPRLRINAARVDVLLGGARSAALYSPDGRAAASQDRQAQRGVRA
jgi:flagellar biosynthesis/type III secretory pathway chaperone